MIRSAAIAVSLLGMVASAASADPGFDPELANHDRSELDAHFGIATVPFDVKTLPEAKGQAFVFVVDETIAVADRLAIGIRVPVVLASVAQPAGSYVDASVLGDPQLRATYRLADRRSLATELAIVGGVELGAPLAGHGESLIPNRALALANGIGGLADPELFTPGTVGITPLASAHWRRDLWSLTGGVRLPLLVRSSDADVPRTTATPRRIGLAGVVLGEVRRDLSRRLSLALAPQLFVDIVPSARHVRSVSRLQDLERVSLYIRLGSRTHLGIELQTALGGELGGSMFGGGLRGLVDLP